MDKKICALIRQTWYETAKKNLQPIERVRFYEMCFEFEFFGQDPDPDAPFPARLLFDMVKTELEKDKERADARSERNRQNGLKGGRPRITEDNTEDGNPKKASGLLQKAIIDKTEQNSTEQNRERLEENEDTHTFFNICLLFFEKGCSDPVGEATTFWNYYAAMGWKTKGGGEVIDRYALAGAWRLKDCSKSVMRNRAPYVDLMHKANPVEVDLISNFISMSRDAATECVTIVMQDRATCILLDQKYMPALQQWIPRRQDGTPYALTYNVMERS